MKNGNKRVFGLLTAGLVAAMSLSAVSIVNAGDKDKGHTAARMSEGGLKIGDTAPAFALKDQNGKDVKLGDFAGKVVVLEWFNDDCPVVVRCYKSKTSTTLAKEFKSKDVVWIAIDSTNAGHDNFGINKDTLTQWGIDFPVLQDAEGTVGKAYGAKRTPHMFIIGKDGKLAYQGAIDNNDKGDKAEADTVNYVRQALNQIIAGETVTQAETKAYGCSVKYKG